MDTGHTVPATVDAAAAAVATATIGTVVAATECAVGTAVGTAETVFDTMATAAIAAVAVDDIYHRSSRGHCHLDLLRHFDLRVLHPTLLDQRLCIKTIDQGITTVGPGGLYFALTYPPSRSSKKNLPWGALGRKNGSYKVVKFQRRLVKMW